MRLIQHGSKKCYTLEYNNGSGDELFFSYDTPVACCIDGTVYKLANMPSMSSSRHANMYTGGAHLGYKASDDEFRQLITHFHPQGSY